MWRIVNSLRILVVALITVFCSVLGVIMLLTTWSRPITLYIDGKIWSSVINWACGVKMKVKGRENIDKSKTYIFVSNHESLLDIPAVFMASTVPIFFLAKRELAKIPVMGWFMYAIGMIFIDRGNSEKARKSMRKAGELIRAGRNVITFPEGTRSKDGNIRMFRRGTFILSKETKIDIIPIGIEGAHEVLASGKTRIRPGTIYVNIGEAIREADHRDKNIEEYAAFTKEKVAALIANAKSVQ